MFIVVPAFFIMAVQQHALAQVRPRVGARGSATLRIDFRKLSTSHDCATYLLIGAFFPCFGASFISELIIAFTHLYA